MWRPALALPSIAVLVTVGLIGYRSWNDELAHPSLAEVKEVKKAEDVKNDKPTTASNELKNLEQPAAPPSADAPSPATASSVGTVVAEPAFAPVEAGHPGMPGAVVGRDELDQSAVALDHEMG